MLIIPSVTFATFGAALALLSSIIPNAAAIPAGTYKLQNFALKIFPKIFPNTTSGWQDAFKDGTWDPNVKFIWNDNPPINGKDELFNFLSSFNKFLLSRCSSYAVSWTGISAYATNEAGTSGFVTLSGNSSVKTLQGDVYTDGTLGAFGVFKWDPALGTTTITEWREATTQPNYPNYPFNTTNPGPITTLSV